VTPVYSIDSAGKRELAFVDELSREVLKGIGRFSALRVWRNESQHRLRESECRRIRGITARHKMERRGERFVAGNSAYTTVSCWYRCMDAGTSVMPPPAATRLMRSTCAALRSPLQA